MGRIIKVLHSWLLATAMIVSSSPAVYADDEGLPAISEQHESFLDAVDNDSSVDRVDHSDTSFIAVNAEELEKDVCVKEDEEGNCTKTAKRYLLEKRRLEENLRALVYLIRTLRIPIGHHQIQIPYPSNNTTVHFGGHKQYGQCFAVGNSYRGVAKLFEGFHAYSQIDIASEQQSRETTRKLIYCQKLKEEERVNGKPGPEKVASLQQALLPKDENGQYMIPNCTPDQEEAFQQQLDLMADMRISAESMKVALQELETRLIGAAVDTGAWPARRGFAIDWEDFFGEQQKSIKEVLAVGNRWWWIFNDGYQDRFYCSNAMVGYKEDETSGEAWKTIVENFVKARKEQVDRAIDELSLNFLSYIEGNKKEDYPTNSHYRGHTSGSEEEDALNNFFDYFMEKDFFVRLQDNEVKDKCKRVFKTYEQNNVADSGDVDEHDKALKQHEPLYMNLSSNYWAPNNTYSTRERYLAKKLRNVSDREYKDILQMEPNAMLQVNYSGMEIRRKLANYCTKFEDKRDSPACRLKNHLEPLREKGLSYDSSSKDWSGETEFEKNDRDYIHYKGYRKMILFMLPGGDRECFDKFVELKDSYIPMLNDSSNDDLNSKVKASYELQEQFISWKKNLYFLTQKRMAMETDNILKGMKNIYDSTGLIRSYFDVNSVFDLNDFALYSANELHSPPPASLFRNENFKEFFFVDEIHDNVAFKGLLASVLAFLEIGFYERMNDSYPYDTSRFEFMDFLRQMTSEYNHLNNTYADDLYEDLTKLADTVDVVKETEDSGPKVDNDDESVNQSAEVEADLAANDAREGNERFGAASGGNNSGINIDSSASFATGNSTIDSAGNQNFAAQMASLTNGFGGAAAASKKENLNKLSLLKKKINDSREKKGQRGINFDQNRSDLSKRFNAARARFSQALKDPRFFSKALKSLADGGSFDFSADSLSAAAARKSGVQMVNGSSLNKKGKGEELDDPFANFSKKYNSYRKPASISAAENKRNTRILEAIEKDKKEYAPKKGDSIFEKLTKRYIISAYPKLLRRLK